MSKLAKMAAVAERLRDARVEVNTFAANEREPAARALMAESVGHHITALQRLHAQLQQPAENGGGN